MKRLSVVFSLFLISHISLFPQTISSSLSQSSAYNDSLYYGSAYKLYGPALRLALHNIIKGHISVSYAALWTSFYTTDVKSNGKVWDMYSDIPGGTPAYEFTFGSNQCGNYSGEGSCYNREHSWPKSWFNDLAPAYTDLFHLYPTDGYVNGGRGNDPFGNVQTPTWISTNGSKVGPNTSPGYTGTITAFEPIQAYKGDFARSHFYMSTRYYTEDAGWATGEGTNKSDLLPWYSNLLYAWHKNDSVSLKETNRNTAVYGIQNNRNPFIDHPEFAAEIWKTDMPPSVVSVSSMSATTTVIDFSRYLDSAFASTPANFVFDDGIGTPASIHWGVGLDVSKIVITTAALQNNATYMIQVKNQRSINAVPMNDTTITLRTSGITAVGRETFIPYGFALKQNYPNPFNPTTVISYELRVMSHVALRVFDLLGRTVATLVNEEQGAGTYSVSFDPAHLPSGVYFYRLTAGQFIETRQMLLLK